MEVKDTLMKAQTVAEPTVASLLTDCWLYLDMAFPSALLGPHSQFHIFSEGLWFVNPLPT